MCYKKDMFHIQIENIWTFDFFQSTQKSSLGPKYIFEKLI